MEEANRVLARSHGQLFSEWISFSLAEQQADLEQYYTSQADGNGGHRSDHLVPAIAADAERQLFLTDLETLRALRDCGWGDDCRPKA
jgi:hypothetical protein